MASDDTGDQPETSFSFAVRELRQANLAQTLTPAQKHSVDAEPLEVAHENRGFDPYNTSGSFDRTKSWARVGKR